MPLFLFMDAKLEKIESQNNQLEKSIHRILFHLESDPRTNTKGLVERVVELERKLEEASVREKVYKAKASVWGMVGATIAAILWEIGRMILSSLK